jgi:hypothetical protein
MYPETSSQHHIAAGFGVNQGRISDVIRERTHLGSRREAEKVWKKQA